VTISCDILRDAYIQLEDVALVVGDPFSATMHTDILLRARTLLLGIPTRVIDNASIMSAVVACGLQPYNFG
jgi:diphthine synthase